MIRLELLIAHEYIKDPDALPKHTYLIDYIDIPERVLFMTMHMHMHSSIEIIDMIECKIAGKEFFKPVFAEYGIHRWIDYIYDYCNLSPMLHGEYEMDLLLRYHMTGELDPYKVDKLDSDLGSNEIGSIEYYRDKEIKTYMNKLGMFVRSVEEHADRHAIIIPRFIDKCDVHMKPITSYVKVSEATREIDDYRYITDNWRRIGKSATLPEDIYNQCIALRVENFTVYEDKDRNFIKQAQIIREQCIDEIIKDLKEYYKRYSKLSDMRTSYTYAYDILPNITDGIAKVVEILEEYPSKSSGSDKMILRIDYI